MYSGMRLSVKNMITDNIISPNFINVSLKDTDLSAKA